jgi:fatty-acyl-CoA synthase
MLSLAPRLHERLRRFPQDPFCVYVALDGGVATLTAGEIAQRAAAVRKGLDALPIARNSLIGVAHKTGPWLHAAWIGAVLAGHRPTIVAPPSPRMEPQKFAEGFAVTLRRLAVDAVVVDGETRSALGDLLPADAPTLCTDGLTPSSAEFAPPPAIEPDAEVAVQHTSGTTGAQKSIGFTSRQIDAHGAAFLERLAIGPGDVIVSWLPLYHDMGFVACFLTPLLHRIPIVELSPFDWATRPTLLFDAIAAHRGTLCWLPNFAFKALSDRRALAAAGQGWDLSRMRAFINCSEPVSAGAIDQFVAALAPHGVARSQIVASYAMAEALFAVSQNPIGAPKSIHVDKAALAAGRAAPATATENAVELVSNGPPLPTMRVSIRDAAGAPLAAGVVGEIWIGGAHVFSGYRSSAANAEIFDAAGFYRTGDLGFILDGEIYVTGRVKDVIILRGRNYHPQDIEEAVGAVAGVAPGRVVAFGVWDEAAGTEKLVILLELQEGFGEKRGEIALAARRLVAQNFDCAVGDLRIAPPRSIVKTTSGKPARADNRRRYLASLATE